MSASPGNAGRLRRVLRLRRLWRKGGEKPYEDRRANALDSNDVIRAEAPNDLETRRRADQLEREIKRHR